MKKRVLLIFALLGLLLTLVACGETQNDEKLTPIEEFQVNLNNQDIGYKMEMVMNIFGYDITVNCEAQGKVIHMSSFEFMGSVTPESYIEITDEGTYTYTKNGEIWTYEFEAGEASVTSNPTNFKSEDFELVDEEYVLKADKLADYAGVASMKIKVDADCKGGTLTIATTEEALGMTVTARIYDYGKVTVELPMSR